MYVLLLPLISKHNSIYYKKKSKIYKTKTLINKKKIPSFYTNKHKISI